MIAQIADRYLGALDAKMREIVDSAPQAPQFNVMLRYPFGWVDEHDRSYNQPTGKRIRPTLLLLCAEAVGGDFQTALPAAAAVEILHNFSLVHDDIQDDSDTRHGRPTVWMLWNRANAINVGDALFSLAFTALATLQDSGVPPAVTLKCWTVFNWTCLELTRGQHLDMSFERQPLVSVDAYISMIRGKSAALIAACAQMGALIGAHDETTAEHFASFGLNLGIAFQIHDDILGIWGDEVLTGKSAATDIISRKKSLPVLYGLSQSEALTALYQREAFTDADVTEAVRLLDEAGAQTYARDIEVRYYEQAMADLRAANPQGAAAQGLLGLTEALFQRQH
ncbi:MAG: polyprenyl synthetase family protein [Chloroflexi bacterium]|nr:polyprenyl synthetase family protein [Chloroflexota bacterium]